MAAIVFGFAVWRYGLFQTLPALLAVLIPWEHRITNRLQRWCGDKGLHWKTCRCLYILAFGGIFALLIRAPNFPWEGDQATQIGTFLLFAAFGCVFPIVRIAVDMDHKNASKGKKMAVDWYLLLPFAGMLLVAIALLTMGALSST